MVRILEGLPLPAPPLPRQELAPQHLVHPQGRIGPAAHARHPAAEVFVQRRAADHAQAIALGQMLDLENDV